MDPGPVPSGLLGTFVFSDLVQRIGKFGLNTSGLELGLWFEVRFLTKMLPIGSENVSSV